MKLKQPLSTLSNTKQLHMLQVPADVFSINIFLIYIKSRMQWYCGHLLSLEFITFRYFSDLRD